jgi:hypothetical protein
MKSLKNMHLCEDSTGDQNFETIAECSYHASTKAVPRASGGKLSIELAKTPTPTEFRSDSACSGAELLLLIFC